MAEDLKKESVKGVVWSGIEKFASSGILFVANILLVRILTPEDFGLLALIAIFVQISQTFIDSGFSNALIQKKDATQIDYSTVFIFNLAISVILYFILFVTAPLIAAFFKNEELVDLTRVIGINLIIGALVSVHKTRLTIQLRFKIQSYITIISSLIGAIVSVYMAYKGWGVWSLVILTLLNTTIQVLLIYLIISWRPSLTFSIKSFKRLFSYSSKLLGASLIHLLYSNIYTIIIGKKFTPLQLGYFNRAETFAMYTPNLVGTVMSRVAFPIFSRIQDDNQRLRKAYSQYIIYASLLIFPCLIGLIVLAKPLILLILKSKWLPMVPMFQILCLTYMTEHLSSININVLSVKGRSDLALRLEIIKKTIAIVIFLISLKWGIIAVCWGRVVYGITALCINSHFTKELIGISLYQQFKDILYPFFCSIIMGMAMYFLLKISVMPIMEIIVSISGGIIIYIVAIYAIKRDYIYELISIFKR